MIILVLDGGSSTKLLLKVEKASWFFPCGKWLADNEDDKQILLYSINHVGIRAGP